MGKYDWRDGPATLGPHSLAKHTILREYVEQYICILTRNGTLPNLSVMLVDGFAGGGEYIVEGQGAKIHEGSPFILIGAVQAALARLNDPQRRRKKPVEVDARFVFIERERHNWAYLKDALDKRKMLDDRVRLVHGAFEDNVDSIIAQIQTMSGRKPRPIFILDQYGYKAIPVETIAKIMRSLPTAEVFLTLAVDNISAHASTAEQALVRLKESLHVDPRTEDFFSGRKDMEESDTLSEEDRARLMLHIQWVLHETFAKHAGATCYTPFFITSRGSNRSYWFLHLANDSKANDVVKALHWNISNHFKHYGADGTRMLILGFDPARQGLARQLPLNLGSDFDDSARARTERALVEELPAIIQAKYSKGVTLKDLYRDLCNETPADKEIVGDAVNRLCKDNELDKAGAHGEERELTTKVKDSDVIRLTKSPGLFSILRSKK